MLNYILLLFIGTVSLLFVSSSAVAAQTHQTVEDFVQSFVKAQLLSADNEKISVEVAEIDHRIKIPQCQTPWSAVLVGNKSLQRAATVRVRCDGLDNWQLHLPVKIIRQVPVIVSSRPLAKGSVLNQSNTTISYIDRNLLRSGYIGQFANVENAKLKRQIAGTQMITNHDICLVCKGENVTITTTVGNLTVKTDGVALSNGILGDKIRVRNSKSQRTIAGLVEAAGLIVINY